MKKHIRKVLSDDLNSRADIAVVLSLADDLGRILESYGMMTFFALADALRDYPDHDARSEAIFRLAREGNDIKTAEWLESNEKSRRVVDEDQAD